MKTRRHRVAPTGGCCTDFKVVQPCLPPLISRTRCFLRGPSNTEAIKPTTTTPRMSVARALISGLTPCARWRRPASARSCPGTGDKAGDHQSSSDSGEGQQPAGDHRRHNHRQRDDEEDLQRRGAKIHRRLFNGVVQLAQARGDHPPPRRRVQKVTCASQMVNMPRSDGQPMACPSATNSSSSETA